MTQAPSQFEQPGFSRPDYTQPFSPYSGQGYAGSAQPGFAGPGGYQASPPPPPMPPSYNGGGGGGGAPRAPRRRPGWAALVIACVGSALLASAVTAGTVSLVDKPTATVTAPASSGNNAPAVKAPVASDGTLDWTKVASAVSPSVVAIKVSGDSASGAGSGVILDKSGDIVTNNHVATGGGSNEQIEVVLSDGRVFDDVKVVGLDPATDLAVLKIVNPPSDLTPAVLGDSSKVVVGQPVMAVGNPLGLADTVTTGIVSATDRPVSTAATESQPQQQSNPFEQPPQASTSGADDVITNAIQTDAAVNPGNSGGALVDATGSVIGVPSSIAGLSDSSSNSQSGSIGLGFAIPSNEAKRIADELIAKGKATHAWLGVSLQDSTATADGSTRQGAKLAQIVGGTPAASAGLKTGDVVISINGENVSGAESLTAQIRERAPGEQVTLGVVRGGKLNNVTVTLGTKGS